MNKDLIFNTHMSHAVIIDGQTYLPTNYLVKYTNILELLLEKASRHKNETFITFYASGGVVMRYTYEEFRRRVLQTANYLRAQGLIEEAVWPLYRITTLMLLCSILRRGVQG